MSSPFDDLRGIISQLPDADACAAKKTNANLARESGSNRDGLHELKLWLSVWQGTENPFVDEAHICVLASSYEGHEYKSVQTFITEAGRGGAAVNALCVDRGVGLRVLELAPDIPHSVSSLWSEAECMAAVAFGMEATAAGGQLLVLSDIAPGNAANALAIVAACSAEPANEFIDGLAASYTLVNVPPLELGAAKKLLKSSDIKPDTPALRIMQVLGGREIAASVGAILAARSGRLPVVIDGWAGIAAAAILEAELPGSTDHVKIASCVNQLAASVVEFLGKRPLLSTTIATGPGCGGAISVALLKAACDI